MVIKEKVQKAVNKQINAELYSSYLYLSMAAYFESISLRGFAHWMKAQAEEERGHAMKLYEYIIDRNGVVTLAGIDGPRTEWKSPLAAFSEAYAHEVKVTSMINDILSLAREEGDYATEEMLDWFVNEQMDEEANPKLIIDKLKIIKDSGDGLLRLDSELGERK